MIKNLKWCISATGLLVCASVHAIDFLDMVLLGYIFLSNTTRNAQVMLASVTTVLGFIITWYFIKRILKPLKVKEFKILIFTLIAYLISVVGGFLIRWYIGMVLILETPLGWWWGLPMIYIILNALLFTLMIVLIFPKLSGWVIFKNMIYANVLSFLATMLCLFVFYKIYPEQPNFIQIINQPKREPDRVREMVKNMPYSQDLSESDFK